MSRNQQIIILVVAIIFSVALVLGAYLKKNPDAFKRGGGEQQQQVQQDIQPVRPPVQNVVDNNKQLKPDVQKNLQEYQKYQQQLQEARKRPAYVNQAPSQGFNAEANAAVGEVVGQLRLLGAALTRAVSRRKLKMEYFERLSFGGTEGVDPNYAVFNPEGIIKFKPMMGKWISQDTLNKVSATKKGRLLYSLRRQKDKYGGTTDVLYAVVPFPSDGLCKMARYSATISSVLPFAADNRSVVEDAPGTLEKAYFKESLCVTMSDGKRIFLYPLRLRHMTKGTTVWQSY